MRPAVLGAALAMMTISTSARAALKIKWDCYLPGTNVNCALLESSLTSKVPFLSPVPDARGADVVVTVTSLPAENATRFKFDFVGRPRDGYASSVHTTDKVPSSIDKTTTLVRVMTKLERGLAEFMDQKETSEATRGKLALVLTDPTDAPFTGRPEQTSKSWYVAPSIGSYLSDVAGVGVNTWASASITFNVSHRGWRLQQGIGASYTQQSQPVAGTNETASVEFAGAWTNNVLSYDLTRDHRLSVALLLAAEKNPQANYRMRGNGSVGLEYDLVPRQTSNQKNFGFHCAVGPEFHRYDATNLEGLDAQIVSREFCDVFFSWHFDPVDLSASVGENVVLKSLDYTSFSAGVGATWRVTDNLIVAPWVSLQEIVKAINEAQPTNVSYTDPKQEVEASMRAAIEQGYTAPFGIQSGLSLKYIFGNGSLASEDQRWRGASSLR
jgi:hypothetical protein